MLLLTIQICCFIKCPFAALCFITLTVLLIACLIRTLLLASLVLLPVLGVTWILGLFAVNSNTTVFAWLFTIFNSLQVKYNVMEQVGLNYIA